MMTAQQPFHLSWYLIVMGNLRGEYNASQV